MHRSVLAFLTILISGLVGASLAAPARAAVCATGQPGEPTLRAQLLGLRQAGFALTRPAAAVLAGVALDKALPVPSSAPDADTPAPASFTQLAFGYGRSVPQPLRQGAANAATPSHRSLQGRTRVSGSDFVAYPPCGWAVSAYATTWMGAGTNIRVSFTSVRIDGYSAVSTSPPSSCSVVQAPCYGIAHQPGLYNWRVYNASASSTGVIAFQEHWCSY